MLRGVEVTLVVPEQDDQLLVSNAQKSYYEELLTTGVKICRYGKRFLHAKHVTIDDRIAWIGSSNMDIRSFALNAEVVLLAYDRGVCGALGQVQARYFEEGVWLDAKSLGRPAAVAAGGVELGEIVQFTAVMSLNIVCNG